MNAPALAIKAETPSARRFEIPDLSRHSAWLVPRLKTAFPHLTDRELHGWLQGLVYSPECLFLYHEHAVGLAQVERAHSLLPTPIIHERFVFAEDKENPEHIAQAASFYDDIVRWAKNLGVKVLVVEEKTDVPHKILETKLKLFTREQVFARLP